MLISNACSHVSDVDVFLSEIHDYGMAVDLWADVFPCHRMREK